MPRYGEVTSARKSEGGISFKIDAAGMSRELERLMKKVGDNCQEGFRLGVKDLAMTIAAEVQQAAPAKHLRDNVEVQEARVTGVGEYKIRIRVNTPDARAWEYGSGLHATQGNVGTYRIKPKQSKLLSFYWKNQGRWVVLPRVNHPGIEAKPFVRPAVKRAIRHINTIMVDSIRRVNAKS